MATHNQDHGQPKDDSFGLGISPPQNSPIKPRPSNAPIPLPDQVDIASALVQIRGALFTDRSVNTSIPEEAVRDRILESARQLFSVRGYRATALREVADMARVTKPMVFYYFGNKEGLFLSCLDEARQVLIQVEQRVLAAEGFRQRVRTLVELHLAVSAGKPELWAILGMALLGPAEDGPKLDPEDPLLSGPPALFERIVSDAITAQEIAPAHPQVATFLLHSVVDRFYGAVFTAQKVPEEDGLPELLADTLLNGLRHSSD